MIDGSSRYAQAVHIICPVHNGAAYLPEFLKSIRAQTSGNWILWVRDDGSMDASADIVRTESAQDERIRLLEHDGQRLGVIGAFDWLLLRIPAEAPYVMFADADDVWLPEKIEMTLTAMLMAEQTWNGPLLVHTDLIVVDSTLQKIDDSFWHFRHINPESTSLQRLVVHNVVSGATAMLNRTLREKVGRIPPTAVMHDWWAACVAGAFGRIVAVSTPSMLYRQHGRNQIGARPRGGKGSWHEWPADLMRAFQRSALLRASIASAARQARALLERYGDELSASDREFLAAYARIPARSFIARKLDIVRLHLAPENGFVRNLGLLLRS